MVRTTLFPELAYRAFVFTWSDRDLLEGSPAEWQGPSSPCTTTGCSPAVGDRGAGTFRRRRPPARSASGTLAQLPQDCRPPNASAGSGDNAPRSSPLVSRVLDLQPREAAAWPVAGVPPLGDNALQPKRTCVPED